MSVVQRTASLDIKPKGWTALHRAAAKNYYPRVNKLCSSTPEDIEAVTNDGLTPIQLAAQYGSFESFLALLNASANAAILTEQGESLTQLAAGAGRLYFIMSLTDHLPYTKTSVLMELCEYLHEMTPTHGAFTQTTLILESLLLTVVKKSIKSSSEITAQLKQLNITPVFETILKRSTQERLVTVAISACKSLVNISPLLAEHIIKSKIPKLLIDMTYIIQEVNVSFVALSVIAELVKCVSDCLLVSNAIGGPIAMLKVLQMHQNSELHKLAMNCITHGSANPQVAGMFASTEILQAMLNVFSAQDQNPDTLIATVTALSSLIQSSYEVKSKCIELGFVDTLLGLLRPFDILTEPCITLLHTLCGSSKGIVEELIKEHLSAVSNLLAITKYEANIHLKEISFEILWHTAGNIIPEQRALAHTIKPNSLIVLTKRPNPYKALIALELISPVVYNMQDEIINEGGVTQLLAILHSSSSTDEMLSAMKVLENLSYGMCLQPNRKAQVALQEVQGFQFIFKLLETHSNEDIRTQAFCTLAAYSNKNPTIKQLILDAIPLSAIIQPLQMSKQPVSTVYMRGVCYLALKSIAFQSKITAHGGLLVDNFLHVISNGSPLQTVETVFQLTLLATVFIDSKPTITVAFSLKLLIKSLMEGIQSNDVDLQTLAGLYISSLIKMRAGLANALVGLKLIPLLVAMLHQDQCDVCRVAAVSMIQLTHNPSALRKLLQYLRREPNLYTTMIKYSCNFTPSSEFEEMWKKFCQTQSHQKRL